MGARPFQVIPLDRIREPGRPPIQCWTCGGWYKPGEYPKHVRLRMTDPRHDRDQVIHVTASGKVYRG